VTLRFAADENFNNDIIRGLRRRDPEFDIVRIQDTEVYGGEDPAVLQWIADNDRLLLTHDVKTMAKFVYERVAEGKSTPGVFIIKDDLAIGKIIEEIIAINEASEAEEWQNKVIYLPL